MAVRDRDVKSVGDRTAHMMIGATIAAAAAAIAAPTQTLVKTLRARPGRDLTGRDSTGIR
jgi:hypothetical protein